MMYRPRLNDHTVVIVDFIANRAPTAGVGVAQILEEFDDLIDRSTVNNVLAALMKAEIVRRSLSEPFRYRLRGDLGPDQQAWLTDAQAALREVSGEDDPAPVMKPVQTVTAKGLDDHPAQVRKRRLAKAREA